MAEQLSFDWPTGVALGPEDFFVSDANATAFALIDNPALWPEGKLALVGPTGSGKSHLARVFKARTDARLIASAGLTADIGSEGPLIVEDIDQLPAAAEEAMFHLHNNLRAAGHPLLMTARVPPSRWQVALPDLASRMRATTPVEIAEPDDALLQALIMKLFADRQIAPPPNVVAYLVTRIERSYAAASRIVSALDAEAMQQQKPITRPMAAAMLDKPATSGR